MLIEETLQKLLSLRMPAMAAATRELLDSAPSNQLSFEDRLGIIVDREWIERDSGASPAEFVKPKSPLGQRSNLSSATLLAGSTNPSSNS